MFRAAIRICMSVVVAMFFLTGMQWFHSCSMIEEDSTSGSRVATFSPWTQPRNNVDSESYQNQEGQVTRPEYIRMSDIKKFLEENPPILKSHGTQTSLSKLIYHNQVWLGKKWVELTRASKICLSTHTTVEGLFWLGLQGWSGPASVSVYTPGTDFEVASSMIHYMRKCYPWARDSVAFHIMYPKDRPPQSSNHTTLVGTRLLYCNDPEGTNKILLDLRKEPPMSIYYQNHNRNLARKNCPTDYIIATDVDMITPLFMTERLNQFLVNFNHNETCKKCAFVIPVYEVQSNATYRPRDKQELLSLLKQGKAQQFHIQLYRPNQENSQLEKWENKTNRRTPEDLDGGRKNSIKPFTVLYNITTYKKDWEPIIVLPYTAPFFEERFVGYGIVRNSHVYLLHRRGYNFSVLDEAFLTHRGFQTSKSYSKERRRQIKINSIRFANFKKELDLLLENEKEVNKV